MKNKILNLINRAANFFLRGYLLDVEFRNNDTGIVVHHQRYIGKDAFKILQAKAQQEANTMMAQMEEEY